MNFPVVYTPEPTKPSGRAEPGARALLEFGIGTFDLAVHGDEITNLGIYNPRDVCGNVWDPKKPNGGWKCKGSQHARGGALDAGVIVLAGGHPEGWRWAQFLIDNHAELGVQEVIFAEHRWDNRMGVKRLADCPKYTGRSKHYDHVHSALNDPAAKGLTMAMILAIWEKNPAPPDQPAPQEANDDMIILIPEVGTDKDKAFLVNAGLRTHIAQEETDGLVKAGVRKSRISAFGWQAVKRVTDLSTKQD